MNIVFQVDGGIGKSIAATAVCKAIKHQYPLSQLIVITHYPEVFFGNPNIYRVLHHNNLSYFYEDYIQGQEVMTFLHNPYFETSFVNQSGHLIKVWCEMFGIQYNKEQPELFINNRELAFYGNQFRSEKPIFVIQTNGGAANQPNKYSWTRDLPLGVAQQIVNLFARDYAIVHIRREDQPALQNTIPVQGDFRAMATLISMSEKRLFIDSFAQHAAAALNKPSTVCWIGNNSEQFGYQIHTNIIANTPTIRPELKHSVFSKYNISGNPTEFPYNNEAEIFDIDSIINSFVVDTNNNQHQTIIHSQAEQIKVSERILSSNEQGSMVAKRLIHLLGRYDLSNVKQILDIGSWHLGQSIEFSAIFQDAKIDAFEPVPDSYNLCLKHRSQLNEQRKSRIHVHNTALSNVAGEIPFYMVDAEESSVPNVGASSMFKFIDGLNGSMFGQDLVQKEIQVQTETLDNWCEQNNISTVDIMWIDVQGSELLVFQGAERILQNTNVIMTEVGLKPYYEGHTLKKDIDAFLIERGFYELEDSFELNGFDYEANTIYIKNKD
jgi:FkbM family methyltransferase